MKILWSFLTSAKLTAVFFEAPSNKYLNITVYEYGNHIYHIIHEVHVFFNVSLF